MAGIERDVEVEPLRHDENGLGWRTRVRLAVDPSGHVGFRRHRSHQLEQVDHCPIACEAVMQTGTFQADWAGVDELEVIVAPDTGESLIAVDTTGAAKGKGTGKGKGAANAKGMPAVPELSARLVVNGRAQQRSGAVHTKVANVTFRVSSGVFWQVHVGAAATLAEAVRSVLDARRGDSVVDLYAGAGLFSVLMARDVGRAGSVLAVERDRRACADAEYNGQGLPQLRVRRASITANLVEKGIGKPGLVVLDPAREGAGKAVMAALHGHAPTLRRVVYVSCDPSSFSRDIRVLLDAGWALTSLRAFDIFPMTEHVELVAALEPARCAALRVPADLVIDVADGLELQGRMLHIEVAGQTALQMVENPTDFTAIDAVVSDHHVRSEDGQGRGERPHMQVMHGGHFVEFEEMAAHLLEVNVIRRGLQQDAKPRPQKPDGGLEHQADNHQRRNGVDPVEPGGDDHDAGNNRPHESVKVREDMAVRALHIEGTPVCPRHRHRCDQVDRDSDRRHGDQHPTVDRHRVHEALNRFNRDERRDDDKGEAVANGCDDLGPLHAERV